MLISRDRHPLHNQFKYSGLVPRAMLFAAVIQQRHSPSAIRVHSNRRMKIGETEQQRNGSAQH